MVGSSISSRQRSTIVHDIIAASTALWWDINYRIELALRVTAPTQCLSP